MGFTMNSIEVSCNLQFVLHKMPPNTACSNCLGSRRVFKLFFVALVAFVKAASTLIKKLDEAVFAAYGWKSDLSDDEILEKLLALNLERSKTGK